MFPPLLWGGGQTWPYLAKMRFPFFYRVLSLQRQKTWSSERMKTGIFQRFGVSPCNSKNEGLGIVSSGARRQSTEKCQIGPTLLIYNELLSPEVLDLDGCLGYLIKSPPIIMVRLLCGRIFCERASGCCLVLLLSKEGYWSEGRGCLQEGRLGVPGVLPDIFRTAIFPRK